MSTLASVSDAYIPVVSLVTLYGKTVGRGTSIHGNKFFNERALSAEYIRRQHGG